MYTRGGSMDRCGLLRASSSVSWALASQPSCYRRNLPLDSTSMIALEVFRKLGMDAPYPYVGPLMALESVADGVRWFRV